MDIKMILLSALCLSGLIVKGQSAAFLDVVPDARAAAMGGVGIATSPDNWSVFWNGAKSAFSEERGGLSYGYIPKTNREIENSRMHTLAGYYKPDARSSVFAGFRRSSLGKFEFDGTNIRPYDYALEAGYARELLKGFSAGATVRYIHSDLDVDGADAANAVSFDLSLYYRMTTGWLNDRSEWSIGANFSNFGTDLSYGVGDNKLPARLAAGSAYKMPFSENHQLTCAFDGGYRIFPSDSRAYDLGVGAEYLCYKIAALRAGYHWGDPEKGGVSYASVGCGVNYHHFHADFAYLLAAESTDALDRTMRLSLGLDFGLFMKKK